MFAKSKLELNINGISIPPFIIKKGEIIYFELNYISSEKKEADLLSALFLESKIKGLTVFTKLAIAKPYCKRLIKTRISEIPEIERLIEESEDECKVCFKQYFNKSIIFLPGNMRALIALHIACSKSKFVAFDTAGMDPLGEQMLFRYIRQKREDGWGFLYFKFQINKLHKKGIFGLCKYNIFYYLWFYWLPFITKKIFSRVVMSN